MGWVIWGFLLLSCSLLATAQLTINEIMYDPSRCPDADCEWVELYNQQVELNLSGCIFDGKALQGVLLPDSYLVLVRDAARFSEFFGNVISYQEISMSLSNSGRNLLLEGREDCQDAVNYSLYVQWADGNNKTLERRSDGTWGESLVDGGTPGRENSIWSLSAEYSVLEITEVLPSPFSADDAAKPDGEWVELYNSGDSGIDLLGLQLRDEQDDNELFIADSNTFGGTIICAGCYKAIYRDGDSDFALNNDFDQVRLLFGDELLDQMSYAGSTEGMSFSKVQGEWYHTPPTPGEENRFTEQCDWQLSLDFPQVLSQPADVEFVLRAERQYGFAQNITVRGRIEDAFGRTVQEYTPWTDHRVVSSVSKSYSPNLPEGIYQVSFRMENLSCADAALQNNQAAIIIATNPRYQDNSSRVHIEKLYLGNDESAEWGDQFTAKVVIYKGDETRQSVQLWAEKDGKKVSKITKVNLLEPFREYPLTLPVQLLANCDEEISAGDATLVVDAFSRRDEEEFEIEGVDEEVCKDYQSYLKAQESSTHPRIQYDLPDVPASLQPGEAFRLPVQILNEEKEHDFSVSAYTYRGNKCYSCFDSTRERDHTAEEVHLQPGEARIVELLLKLDDGMEDGEYRLKVNVRKDQQKTTTDITKPFVVRSDGSAESTLTTAAVADGALADEVPASRVPYSAGIVVYQSNTEKARQLIPYILLVALGLTVAIVLRKK